MKNLKMEQVSFKNSCEECYKIKTSLRNIIKATIAEAEIPDNEITKEENLNSTVQAIKDLFNVCDLCGRIHSDGTRNNCK